MEFGNLMDSGVVLVIGSRGTKSFIAAEYSENLIELADNKEKKEQNHQDLERQFKMAKFYSICVDTCNFANLCCLE